MPSSRENGTLFPKAFISPPPNVFLSVASCGNDNRRKDIYLPSSRFAALWRRSARQASFVPSSFSLFFRGAPPLQCRTTARAVGPILRLVPGTDQQEILLTDELTGNGRLAVAERRSIRETATRRDVLECYLISRLANGAVR